MSLAIARTDHVPELETDRTARALRRLRWWQFRQHGADRACRVRGFGSR